MTRRLCCTNGLAWLASSCGQSGKDLRTKAIAGGVAIDPGGETFQNSVVLIAGSRLHTIGSARDTGIPPGSIGWSSRDRFVIPAPVELIGGVRMADFDTLASASKALTRAPEVVEGIVSDSDRLPVELIDGLARYKTIVVPRLARLTGSPSGLARGLEHVRTLVESGIRMASFADYDVQSEWRLLAKAGLTPRQVLESATWHAAQASRLHDSVGALRPGFLANLWVLRLDPLLHTDNLSSVDSIMTEGIWRVEAEGRRQ